MTPARLESCITRRRERMLAAGTAKGRARHWVCMRILIYRRTPETVAAMERKLGLH